MPKFHLSQDQVLERLAAEGGPRNSEGLILIRRDLETFRALSGVLEETARLSGRAFFERLVGSMARHLGVRYAFVGKLQRNRDRVEIQTLAVWADGKLAPNFSYDLAGTPCEGVVDRDLRLYPRNVQELFKDDILLAEMAAESYVGAPTFDAGATPLGLIAILDDKPMEQTETARTVLESFSQRVGAELEQMESHAAIVRAKEEAERTTQAKDRFLANMSHEIRTPLNGILGLTSLLQERPLDSEEKDLVRALRSVGEDLLAIVDDVLDFSHIDGRRVELKDEEIDLSDLVSDIVSRFAPLAEQNQVQIASHCPFDPGLRVRGDRIRLNQVLSNLVSNAIKFTRDGHVRIEVSEPEAGIFRFLVADTGIGIPEGTQARIFLPFEQGDGSLTRRFGGTGLGLPIAQRVIEQMGGQLELQSTEGLGSCFSFAIALESVEAPRRTGGSAPGRDLPDLGPQVRVLLVEDHATNRMVAARLLERLGCEVASVDDGAKAVERLATDRSFDAVLMDLHMPEMDGYEATRRIREMGLSTPIIALTADLLPGTRSRCIESGMDDYLTKPIDTHQLQESLHRWTRSLPAA